MENPVYSHTVIPARFKPDCAACCGLCCVTHPFDSSQGFGYDKPAQTPCVNLQPDFRCSIHSRLRENGFPGCISFDCYGAGQWVTQRMFKGTTWSDSASIAKEMFDAYSRFKTIHELMVLLIVAQQHVTDKDLLTRVEKKLQDIETVCRQETEECGKVDISTIKQDTMDILRNLGTASDIVALAVEKGYRNDN